ncbi:hypothetical protein AN216_03865 [Streptomyces oceani]|uniref:Uncharacterized protein n=2 Tax=Streptomyces oceani TaxID=1075402 RepID=A0A1E7KN60_9ACTN|nr:hypothetical protein AN216_03865 [Streptomyces oceani]
MQTQTEKKSSELLDIMDLQGKVTEPGAIVAPCSDYPSEDGVIRAPHPWSLYDVPVERMREGMDRLREKLPKSGWRITKDGTDSSRSKSPQIIADSTDGKYSADIRFWEEPESSDEESMIVVTVVSSCFRSR